MNNAVHRATAAAIVALVVVLVVVLSAQTPAFARAEVVSSSPENGATIPAAPEEVFIRFDENVSLSFGGLTVVDEKGDPVDDGEPTHGETDDIVRVGLVSGLGDGTYVVNYRVASQDGQPVAGAVLFTVGKNVPPSGGGGTIQDTTVLDRQTTSDKTLHITAGVFRFLTIASALLAAGLAGFLAFIHDQQRDRWKLAHPIRIGSLVAAFAAIGTVFMEAALVSGRGLSGAGNMTVIRDVLGDGLGWSTAMLLVGLALVHLSTDTNRLVVAQTLSFYGALTVTVSFALRGHSYAATNQSVAIISDAIHVTAAAIWFGGLVGLVATIASRHRADNSLSAPDAATTRGTARILGRFSIVAAVSVVALLVSGGILTSTQLHGPSALTSSTYGRVLSLKILFVVVVCALAAYNRFRLVPAIRRTAIEAEPTDEKSETRDDSGGVDPQRSAWLRLFSVARIEALTIVAVLAVTSALVAVDPPRPTRTGPRIFNEWADLARGGKVTMNINPNRVGPNTIHIQYYDESGRPDRNVTEAQIEFLFPENGIGPIERKALRGGSGHFIYQGTELSIPGRWQVNVLAQITQFDQERTYFEVDVSK